MSKKMIESRESDYKTMALFLTISLVIVFVYLVLFQVGIVQSIELASGGLIHPTLILNALLLASAVLGVLVYYGKLQWTDFGLIRRKLPVAVVVCAISWALVQIVEGLIGFIGTGVIEIEVGWNTEALGLIGLLIGMLFGTALYEEVGYRGFLLIQFKMKMSQLTTTRYLQVALGLLISQMFFTLIHIPWKVMNQGLTVTVFFDLVFSVFLNGLIYGLLYLRTENLFFVMIVHALGNAPTSLVSPSIGPSSILLLLAIIWAAVWPQLRRLEKGKPEVEDPSVLA
ncbi:MAG: CPBP family intramembrane metalloprotease [Candidatus Thorarchaeota archaeon]|nr:MAG: CPBP family intramembrane metalloprotease [Candidatus Thorarchaeota archaeon]